MRLLDLLAYMYQPIIPALVRSVTIRRRAPRGHEPRDILLPRGYVAEVVATGFDEPVHCCFDDAGHCYVVECGHKIETKEPPRVLRVDTKTGEWTTFFQLPMERWKKSGGMTGACWHRGEMYLSNTDEILRIAPDGSFEPVVTGLPTLGDHQTNHPVVGPDGKLYWGSGSSTNTGVVGADNFGFEWLRLFPQHHDVPARDVTLAGRNFTGPHVLGTLTDTATTGAFSPFGTATTTGQVIRGDVKCTGAVLRCDTDGSGLEVVAWGLRNPYGLAFAPDGRLFATEHGIDERGARFIANDLEDLYEIREGAWYGWPDFASGIRLDDPRWRGGQGREPVLAQHPDPDPPKPFATFEPHSAPNGLDFSRDPSFGFEGDAFVALFGDFAPVTTQPIMPRGFKVVRVDMRSGKVHDFAVNKMTGPASKLPHDGFERPSHCAFGPDGALYVVDFGEIEIALERGGARVQAETGTLWRIRRVSADAGDEPPRPMRLPHTGLLVAAAAAVLGLVAALLVLLIRAAFGR